MLKHHNFEDFMKKTIEVNTEWLLKEESLPQPIDQLYLWSAAGRIEVAAIIVESGNQQAEILHGDYPRETSLPIDDADDEVLAAFLAENRLEDGDIYWGNYFGLPESLYRMEMIRCAHAVVENVIKNGIQFTTEAKIGIRMDDEDYDDPEIFAAAARTELNNLEPDVARALLALFYSDVNKLNLL